MTRLPTRPAGQMNTGPADLGWTRVEASFSKMNKPLISRVVVDFFVGKVADELLDFSTWKACSVSIHVTKPMSNLTVIIFILERVWYFVK